MGTHPLNLGLRFILEIAALVATGMWGWRQTDSWLRFILALGIPILLAVIWGTFAVPDDPSRSGNALIVTPGLIRLIIEIAFFAFATWSLYTIGYRNPAMIFAGIVVVHYLMSYDRISWLLAH